MKHFRYTDCVLLATFTMFAAGCVGCSDAEPTVSTSADKLTQSSDPATDALAKLRSAAERGKSRATELGGIDGDTLTNVSVDVVTTSSLMYPYVGRITSEWTGEDGNVDGLGLYFKYEDGEWVPTWANRGGTSWGVLTDTEALRTPSDPRFSYSGWSSTTSMKFKIWVEALE